jgi:flagellar biogenesis protein FliO
MSSCPALPVPAAADVAPLRILQNTGGLLTRGLNWIRARQSARSNNRRLQVAATVSLGDKRFVALIQIDGLQFLVGGGATNVALLAQLHGKESFGDYLQETMTVDRKPIGDLTAEQAREQK